MEVYGDRFTNKETKESNLLKNHRASKWKSWDSDPPLDAKTHALSAT